MPRFTLSNANLAPAVQTCVGSMSGTSTRIAGAIVAVDVYNDNGGERTTKVRSTIMGIDPAAVEG